MKKITFYLLGALIASIVPCNGLGAQNVLLHIGADPLDRAALTSATIYAANPSQNYYVDAAQLDPSMAGSALEVNSTNLPVSTELNLVEAGRESYFTANVDSATYAMAFIVVRDANNRSYVIANASRDELDKGYFRSYNLFFSEVDGEYWNNVTYNQVVGQKVVPVVDSQFYFYSSLDQAVTLCADSSVLYLIDTVNLSAPLTITHPMKIYQSYSPIVSTYTGSSPLVTVTGTEVSWFGTNIATDITMAGTGDIFDVTNSVFNLRQFAATAGNSTVVAHGTSALTLAGCTLGSVSDAEAVKLYDDSRATISTVSVTGSTMAVMDDNATGFLTVLDSTAAATPAALGADAYFKSGNYRKYSRTLALSVAAANDTVFLARNTNGLQVDTLDEGAVIDLNGNTIHGSLYIENASDTVFLQNGRVNFLSGTAAAGTLCVNNLDSVGSLIPVNMDVEIRDGRFHSVTPATGANVTIKGGKYAQRLTDYLAPRHTFVDNPDADAVDFAYKVVEGYTVRFVNYNGRNQDSVAVINTPDNRIVPAPSRPTYVGADTIFSAYFTTPAYRTPWNFLNDVLTGDDTLYAKWYIYNSATDARYTVYHHRQALDGSYPISDCDSTFGVVTKNSSLDIPSNIYVGFTANHDTLHYASVTTDMIVDIYYARDTFEVYYRPNGGQMPGGANDTLGRFVYGGAVTYPTPVRPGYTFNGWVPTLTTMPAYNFITNAVYTQNTYPVTWTNAGATFVYNGAAVNSVSATYVDDNGNTVNAILSYFDATGNPVSEARTVGVYTVTANPVDPSYTLTGTVTTNLTIVPASVAVTGIVAETAKLYDGNTNATVTNSGTPVPRYGNDDVDVIVTAQYDNASVGENKTITAYLLLTGADAYNYSLMTTTQVITNTGAIVAPVTFSSTIGDNGIVVDASGYCSGDASGINYYLTSGNVNQYKLDYSTDAQAQGFVDKGWTNITTAGTVDIDIPVNAAAGNYSTWLTLRNSAHPQFESPRVAVTFHVNLSRNYTMPIFSDVISIVDTCNCIDHSSVKWYHNGVYVGDGPYYQEVGGLTGTYHVTLTMNNVPERTCEQTDVTTLVTDAAPAAEKVTVYPNPVIDRATISIENADRFNHTLTVMNVLGMTLVNTTFDGNATEIDLSSFGHGSYTVSVDGIVVRVIKK